MELFVPCFECKSNVGIKIVKHYFTIHIHSNQFKSHLNSIIYQPDDLILFKNI
jgi:hypothetical protein